MSDEVQFGYPSSVLSRVGRMYILPAADGCEVFLADRAGDIISPDGFSKSSSRKVSMARHDADGLLQLLRHMTGQPFIRYTGEVVCMSRYGGHDERISVSHSLCGKRNITKDDGVDNGAECWLHPDVHAQACELVPRGLYEPSGGFYKEDTGV